MAKQIFCHDRQLMESDQPLMEVKPQLHVTKIVDPEAQNYAPEKLEDAQLRSWKLDGFENQLALSHAKVNELEAANGNYAVGMKGE